MTARRLVQELAMVLIAIVAALALVSSVAYQSFADFLRTVVAGGVFWLVAAVFYAGLRRVVVRSVRHRS